MALDIEALAHSTAELVVHKQVVADTAAQELGKLAVGLGVEHKLVMVVAVGRRVAEVASLEQVVVRKLVVLEGPS